MAEILGKSPAEIAQLHPNHPDILSMSLGAYAVLGNITGKDPETIHRRRWCVGVTLAFYEGLEEMGYTPRTVIRTRGLLQPHHYLDLESERGLILVDGTWQQYVPRNKRNPSLPKVAVGTADEVVALAVNAGVADRNLVYWEEARHSSVQYEHRTRLEPLPPLEEDLLPEAESEMHLRVIYRLEVEV